MKTIVRFKVTIITAFLAITSTGFADTPIESDKLLKDFVHPPLQYFADAEHNAEARKYQGIPTIERAANGRFRAAWCAGLRWEDKYNYLVFGFDAVKSA